MPLSPSATQGGASALPVRGASGWLALAAAPTFALMAWVAAIGTPPIALCSAAPGILPIGSMTTMYLLMSLFHLSPWLKLVSASAGART